MTTRQAKFTTGSIFKHITVMTMTASIGLMAIFMVDLVDMIFISMLGKSELAAAVGYAGAVLFFTTSFGIGMSISAGALVARALGAGDAEMASRRAATAMTFGVLAGAVFAAVVWLNIGSLLRLLGASGDTLTLGTHYLQIIVPSLPFLLAGMVGGAILRAHGAAKQAMMATILGGLVNAIMDPILIFGFDLELTGAAIASVAARLPMRVRQSFWGGLKFAAIVAVLMSALLFGLRGPIVALFRVDGITAEIVILFCGPLALAFYFNGVIFVANAAFNNLGRPFYSTWINWGRHTLGTIPFVMLGGLWFGAKGVLIGQAFGGFVFALVAVVLVRRVIADEGDHGHKSAPFQRQGRLMSRFRFRR